MLLARKAVSRAWPCARLIRRSSSDSPRLAAEKEEIKAMREPLKQALSEFLSPEFVAYSVFTPKLSTTSWAMMAGLADEHAGQSDDPFTQDKDKFLTYLKRYFSDKFVHRLSAKLHVLESSWLGLEYTFRFGKAVHADTILQDLQRFPAFEPGQPLHRFFGLMDEEWLEEYDLSDEEETSKQSIAAAERREEQAVKHYQQNLAAAEQREMMQKMVFEGKAAIVRKMSSMHAVVQVKTENCLPVAVRSQTFTDLVVKSGEQHGAYDPPATCHLYHGMYRDNLTQFKNNGVQTFVTQGDLGAYPAFYTFNFVRQAFEHPMHFHLARAIDEPMAVVAFEVDVAVLHGLAVPQIPSRKTPFKVKRFVPGEDVEEWLQFCRLNIKMWSRMHDFDIVIGPACVPSPDASQAKQLRVPGAQVAFFTDDAMHWINLSFLKVYQEQLD